MIAVAVGACAAHKQAVVVWPDVAQSIQTHLILLEPGFAVSAGGTALQTVAKRDYIKETQGSTFVPQPIMSLDLPSLSRRYTETSAWLTKQKS
jgi:hypothetical protein